MSPPAFSILLILGSHLFVFVASTQPELNTGHVYTSCDRDTKWTKGYGPPIESWLKSVQQLNAMEKNQSWQNHFNTTARFWNLPGDEELNLDGVFSNSGSGAAWISYGRENVNGWLYGKDMNVLDMSGENLAYLYPDFRTVLLGDYIHEGYLGRGVEARVKAFRCRHGVMELQFTKPKPDAVEFTFEDATETFLTALPKVRDPYEKRMVYIGDSVLPGEGLFSKRDVGPNVVVAFYAGLLVFDESALFFDNMTADESENVHKNFMSYDNDITLDIPPGYDNIINYRASLAHKSNHKFDSNLKFDFFDHPRFGHIRCLTTKTFVRKNEELFVDYEYDVEAEGIPKWYLKLQEEKSQPKKLAEYIKNSMIDPSFFGQSLDMKK